MQTYLFPSARADAITEWIHAHNDLKRSHLVDDLVTKFRRMLKELSELRTTADSALASTPDLPAVTDFVGMGSILEKHVHDAQSRKEEHSKGTAHHDKYLRVTEAQQDLDHARDCRKLVELKSDPIALALSGKQEDVDRAEAFLTKFNAAKRTAELIAACKKLKRELGQGFSHKGDPDIILHARKVVAETQLKDAQSEVTQFSLHAKRLLQYLQEFSGQGAVPFEFCFSLVQINPQCARSSKKPYPRMLWTC